MGGERMIGALIWWIIVGLIAGVIAKLLMPGRDPGGFIITILLGIVGAVIGGYLLRAVGIGTAGSGFIWTIIAGIIGALILLAIYHFFAGRHRA
jgi:uncharacterized membrane protein YeaQ/YmgE (transglycosylase-associated protein family)